MIRPMSTPVLACRVPAAIEREIGFAVDRRVSRRAQLATAGTVLAARLALRARHRLQHRRRQPSRQAGPGRGLLHLQRCRGGGSTLLWPTAPSARCWSSISTCIRATAPPRSLPASRAPSPSRCTASAITRCARSRSDLDIGLPDGTGDAAYLEPPWPLPAELAGGTAPGLVFYNAGVDPHADDRLGRLALTDGGLRPAGQPGDRAFPRRGIPVCGVIGGGYGADVRVLAERHAILFEVAAEFA